MIYLLQDDLTPSGYMLMERMDDEEIFYGAGIWGHSIPSAFTAPIHEDAAYKNGVYINWWSKAYSDYVDATLIVRCKSHASYLKWVSEHPELFI